MIDSLIEKYKKILKDFGTGEYLFIEEVADYHRCKEIIKDLEKLKKEIYCIDTSQLKTDGINHKIIIKKPEEIINEIIGIDK